MLFRRVRRALCLTIATITAILLGAGQAAAQGYPSKAVHIVVPASPGGASDLVARAVKGDYFEIGKLHAKRRRKDVRMNTEVRDVDEAKVEAKARKAVKAKIRVKARAKT